MFSSRSTVVFLTTLAIVVVIGWWIQRLSSPDQTATDTGGVPLEQTPEEDPKRPSSSSRPEEALPPTLDENGHEAPSAKESDEVHSHIIRSREGFAEVSVAHLGNRFQEGQTSSFAVPLFPGDDPNEITVEIQRYQETRFGGGVLRGTVPGYPGSLVSVSQVGEAEAGAIHLPTLGKVYEIRPGPNGTTLFSAIDARELGECLLCLEANDVPPPEPPRPQPLP
ncbi:MAG: hypothetical protein LAT55_00105 [Opitutales bacterium]|nr:hypothetical protein [Opitutales bacterium]